MNKSAGSCFQAARRRYRRPFDRSFVAAISHLCLASAYSPTGNGAVRAERSRSGFVSRPNGTYVGQLFAE